MFYVAGSQPGGVERVLRKDEHTGVHLFARETDVAGRDDERVSAHLDRKAVGAASKVGVVDQALQRDMFDNIKTKKLITPE